MGHSQSTDNVAKNIEPVMPVTQVYIMQHLFMHYATSIYALMQYLFMHATSFYATSSMYACDTIYLCRMQHHLFMHATSFIYACNIYFRDKVSGDRRSEIREISRNFSRNFWFLPWYRV